jgi:hypothetical protein
MRHIPGGVQLIIPTTPKVSMLFIMMVWLVGWAWGEFSVAQKLNSGSLKADESKEFLILGLLLWILGGIWALFGILWNLAGREVISFKMPSLVVRRELLGLGRSQEFDLNLVKDLRASQEVLNASDFSTGLRYFGFGGGSIAFDYGPKTHRFGSGLDESEAKSVVVAIKEACSR